MKKLIIPFFAIFSLAFTANAQDKMGKKGHHPKHQKGAMAKQLNFSEEQKKQAKAINEDSRKKMQELNKNENITVKEMRIRKAAIQKERKANMERILTTEQKSKITAMKAERKAKNDERIAKRFDKMKTSLSLSDEQVTKLQAQRSAMQTRAEKIKNNEALSMEQKKEQLMALRTEAKEQQKKILTPDQLKKREEMKKNRGNRSRVK
jgi:Spy/CpxP family protein refolding chaperone